MYHLPRYQFTAMDVLRGGKWYAYAKTKDSLNAAIFIKYLLSHLQHYVVSIKETIIQTDNGVEFIGNVLKKSKIWFIQVLENDGVPHVRIPPRECTYVSHKIIEDEFYDIEEYNDLTDFMAKAQGYELYFNFNRKNRYSGCKAPIELLKESNSNISPKVFNLPPIIIDNFIDDIIKGVYYVVHQTKSVQYYLDYELFY